MYYDLMKLKTEMDMTKYTLKDLALYFEKFDGYVCKITTERGIINFKFDTFSLPHLIGMQYAFENRRDKHRYKGESGFNKLKNGEVTYEQLKFNTKNNNKIKVSWKNIDERIKFLPMFLNSLTTKTKLKSTLGINEEPERYTKIKGNYFLYRELHNNSIPMFSLKMITKTSAVLETFIVDSDRSMTRKLESVKIKDITLIPPLENTTPIIGKDEVFA